MGIYGHFQKAGGKTSQKTGARGDDHIIGGNLMVYVQYTRMIQQASDMSHEYAEG